jgi:hypothetical protein
MALHEHLEECNTLMAAMVAAAEEEREKNPPRFLRKMTLLSLNLELKALTFTSTCLRGTP